MLWDFLRPMLSPRLGALNRDALVLDERPVTTVDLTAHRGECDLAELDLGDEEDEPRRSDRGDKRCLSAARGRARAGGQRGRRSPRCPDSSKARISSSIGAVVSRLVRRRISRPARSLYADAGITPRGPFANHADDPNRTFTKLSLDERFQRPDTNGTATSALAGTGAFS